LIEETFRLLMTALWPVSVETVTPFSWRLFVQRCCP
jgi:hypothetical protein